MHGWLPPRWAPADFLVASYVEKLFRTQQGDVCAFCGHFVPTFPSFYPVLRIISATRSHLQLLQFTLSGQEPDLVLVVGWLFGCVLGVGFGGFWGLFFPLWPLPTLRIHF